MMIKLMTAVAVMLMAVGVYAGGSAKLGSITTSANTTVFTNAIPLTGGNDKSFVEIEQIQLKNNSSETGSVVIASYDATGIYTAIATTSLIPGATSLTRPLYAGDIGSASNTVKLAVQNLRLITTLSATNAVVSSIGYSIYFR